ncbi:MAG: hypothetical protein WCI11_19460, partial [Candidatus Methylumidiphilus sp.]
AKEAEEKAAKGGYVEGPKKSREPIETDNTTTRDKNGKLRDKNGKFAKDPNAKGKSKDSYKRSQSERRKALLRDAKDPNSGLNNRSRKQIIDSKGKTVPKGYEVSHEQPLYTRGTNEGKAKLDKAENMKTQRKSEHRDRHRQCGDQYHEYGPSNSPTIFKP